MTAIAPTMRRRQRWRRGLTLVATAVAVLTTTTYWLADSGAVSIPAPATPSGVASGGDLATLTPLDPSTVVPSNGGQSVDGMVLGKVTVAAGFADRVKVDLSWIDPQDAGGVLHNQNAWIGFGLYKPLHTGSCHSESSSVSITDGSTYCVQRITQVSGQLLNDGTLTLGQTILSGYIVVDETDPATPLACTSGTSSWCAPSGLSNQNAIYVVATVYNAGGNAPPGQQGESGTLSFYMAAAAVN